MSSSINDIIKISKKDKKVQFKIDDEKYKDDDLIKKISSDIQICTNEFFIRYPNLSNDKSKEIIKYMFELLITSNPMLDKDFYINFITSQINTEQKSSKFENYEDFEN